MKSILTFSAAFLAMAVSASATLYTDTNTYYTDQHNGPDTLGVKLNEGQVMTDMWSYGPMASGETVTKVETWFKLFDNDSDKEVVYIQLGVGESPVDFTFSSGVVEFGGSYLLNWSFTPATNASLLADAANGFLSYSVTASNQSNLSNDLYLEYAKVNVTTSSVPDSGATIAFLGFGLLAMAGAQRRFSLIG